MTGHPADVPYPNKRVCAVRVDPSHDGKYVYVSFEDEDGTGSPGAWLTVRQWDALREYVLGGMDEEGER